MKRIILIACAVLAFAGSAPGADKVGAQPADVDAAVKAMFKSAPADWQSRIEQDETQRICSETRNDPKAPIWKKFRRASLRPSWCRPTVR